MKDIFGKIVDESAKLSDRLIKQGLGSSPQIVTSITSNTALANKPTANGSRLW